MVWGVRGDLAKRLDKQLDYYNNQHFTRVKNEKHRKPKHHRINLYTLTTNNKQPQKPQNFTRVKNQKRRLQKQTKTQGF